MLKPLHDQFVVEEMEVKISGTTLILNKKIHPTQQGRVVAISDGYYENDNTNFLTLLPVVVGDVVVFPRDCGQNFELENKKLILLKKEHIIGILTD